MTSISHVVLVSWKSGKQIHAEELVGPSVRGFVGTIPGVLAVVEGHSTSPEGLEPGYHYGFIVTFATPQARDAHLNDPNHRLGPSGSACKPTRERARFLTAESLSSQYPGPTRPGASQRNGCSRRHLPILDTENTGAWHYSERGRP